jgi:deazaflavin-dependent oxidoreductase (nitroreductase family)
VQIKGEKFRARARDAEGDERERLWRLMNGEWSHYDEYQEKTERAIPVVVLERI